MVEKLQDQLARIYDSPQEHPELVSDLKDGGDRCEAESQTEHNDEEYDFRLFASLTDPSKPTRDRITLKSPTPPSGEPGFVKARRSDAYYFTGPLKLELQQQYRQAAISGDQIEQGLITRWVRLWL